MTTAEHGATIDELLERAVDAVNRGDLETAHRLAEQVLESDAGNVDAGDLLATDAAATGELRRVTIVFCDLVGSTALSSRHDPEVYRRIVGRYKETCRQIVEDVYGGRVTRITGDGLLVLFGFPAVHEDDAHRAVLAGLDIVAAMRELSARAEREVGESLAARVAVHRGVVYVDIAEQDIYGLAANIAARLHELAAPGSVVVSEAIMRLEEQRFATEVNEPQIVKGIDEPLASFTVIGELADSPAKQWSTPLIGRLEELGALRAAWADRPGAVLVRGDAGIGKSRITRVLATEAASAGAQIVDLTGSPTHAASGFHPIRGLLESRCHITRDTDGAERLHLLRTHLEQSGPDADQLLPLLGPVLGLDPTAGYAPTQADAGKLSAAIASATLDYLAADFAGDPACLVADDIQWFDESTLDLLSRLIARKLPNLLVVMTARSGMSPPASGVSVIDLVPLSAGDSRALIEAIDPDGVTTAQRDELIERSDGVPLYVEELVQGAFTASFSQPHDREQGDLTVPEVLYEPLLARLYATEGAVMVAEAAAAIGREVDRDLLAAIVDLDDADLDDAVAALVRGFILERVDAQPERYRFRHELLREVAYDLLAPSTRRSVHGRVADALAAGLDESDVIDWVALARHYELAERNDEAIMSYQKAANEARRRGALGEAREHLGRAIDLIPARPDGPRRDVDEVQLRLRRGFLTVSTEGYASTQAAADYERCLELAVSDPGGDEMFSTLISMWGYYTVRGRISQAYQVLEVLQKVLSNERAAFRPQNDAGFGMLHWFSGRFDEARELLEAAARTASQAGTEGDRRQWWFVPSDPLTAIYTHLALARFATGDPGGAREAIAEADRQAATLPFPQGPFSAAYNHSYASWIQLQLGDLDEAAAAAEAVARLAEAHGFEFWMSAAAIQKVAIEIVRDSSREPIDSAALSSRAGELAGLAMIWQLLDARLFLSPEITMVGLALGYAGEVAAARDSGSMNHSRWQPRPECGSSTPRPSASGQSSLATPSNGALRSTRRSNAPPHKEHWSSSFGLRSTSARSIRRRAGSAWTRSSVASRRPPRTRSSTPPAPSWDDASPPRASPSSAAAWPASPQHGGSASRAGKTTSSRSRSISGDGSSVGRAPAPAACTDGSKSTACTSGSATTRTRSACSASATRSSTVSTPTPARLFVRGPTRSSPRRASASRNATRGRGSSGSPISRRTMPFPASQMPPAAR